MSAAQAAVVLRAPTGRLRLPTVKLVALAAWAALVALAALLVDRPALLAQLVPAATVAMVVPAARALMERTAPMA